MDVVNVHEAKTHFSKLLERVERGEEVVIARRGHPIARLVPHAPAPKQRVPGLLRGKIVMGDDFDDPLPEEIQKYFEGRGD